MINQKRILYLLLSIKELEIVFISHNCQFHYNLTFLTEPNMESKSDYPQFASSAPPYPDYGPPPLYVIESNLQTTSQSSPLISSSINDVPVHYDQPIARRKPIYGLYSQTDYCPNCKQNIATRTSYKIGLVTWVASAACILLGGFLGCCLIPCCTDFTRDVEHYCPLCNLKLGLHQRI